jgi:hypothetical protein
VVGATLPPTRYQKKASRASAIHYKKSNQTSRASVIHYKKSNKNLPYGARQRDFRDFLGLCPACAACMPLPALCEG